MVGGRKAPFLPPPTRVRLGVLELSHHACAAPLVHSLSRPFSLSGEVCFFGRSAYFAEEAAYSNSYRHRTGGAAGESQLFLALVAVGRPEERTFGVPSDAACKATKHPAAGFDSIHADVGGPGKAVMAYKVAGLFLVPVFTSVYAAWRTR